MVNKKQNSVFFIIGIFLLGACMRAPIVSIPSIIPNIAASLRVPASSLGVLTTLPLICFGVVSPFVSTISRKVGNELTIGIMLMLLFIGSYMRAFNQTTLFIGTLVVGITITFINVLMPAIITANMPTKIGILTSLYTISITLFSAIGSAFSAPIAAASSWQTVIKLISCIILITLVLWIPMIRHNHRVPSSQKANDPKRSVWKNKTAWFMMLYFGFGSFVFYTLVTWLPSEAISAGLSQNTAGMLAGIFQLTSVPFSFIAPTIAVKLKNRTPIIASAAILTIIGITGLMFPMKSVTYFIIINIVLGAATASTFSTQMTLFGLKTHRPSETSDLSGMSQSIGYLIAAIGPIVAGNLQSTTHSWASSNLLIIVIAVIFGIFGTLAEKQAFIFND